jgi:hypothetical protein
VTIQPIFAWYDLWVGAYWSAKDRTLYLFPVPMLGVRVGFGPRPFRVGDTVEIEGGDRGVLVEINPERGDDRYRVWLGYGHARERREVRHPGTRPTERLAIDGFSYTDDPRWQAPQPPLKIWAGLLLAVVVLATLAAVALAIGGPR